MVFSRGYPNDKRERMEFSPWSWIVVDLPLSSIYYRSSPSIEHIEVMAELHAFPTPLTRTFEPFFRRFNELLLLINPGTTQSFSVIHHHTWGLRGVSRGRDKLPLVYFAAIVPVIRQIPYLETPYHGDTDLP
jgi:hypothetical protein